MGIPRYQRVVVTGGQGQLARAVGAAAPPGTECRALSHAELDITDAAALAAMVAQADLVVNGAAYNLVDRAESDGMEAAWSLNALGPSRLAAACRSAGVPLVHFSTDFVFDGNKPSPYTEDDATRPLGVYAASKLAGENAVLAAADRNIVVRVCRLFGPKTPEQVSGKPQGNFPALMMKLGRERDTVRVVDDQIGAPSYTPDLAAGLWQLIERSDGGLYQLSNAGEVSFADYARTVFELAGLRCMVEGVSSEAYGAAARRPKYSTLDNAKATACGVTPLRHWQEALEEFIAKERQ